MAKDFKIPGGDMPGIYYLRNVVDADKLVAAIAELKKTDGKARAAFNPNPNLMPVHAGPLTLCFDACVLL